MLRSLSQWTKRIRIRIKSVTGIQKIKPLISSIEKLLVIEELILVLTIICKLGETPAASIIEKIKKKWWL